VRAPGPDAGSEHFVFVKDNDFYYNTAQGDDLATIFRLQGTLRNPLLKQVALLDSGVASVATSRFAPTIQVVPAGTDLCMFMADSNEDRPDIPNEITAFEFPSMKRVGSFSDPTVAIPQLGTVILARGRRRDHALVRDKFARVQRDGEHVPHQPRTVSEWQRDRLRLPE
jgi:hypothetical protein